MGCVGQSYPDLAIKPRSGFLSAVSWLNASRETSARPATFMRKKWDKLMEDQRGEQGHKL